MRVVCLVPSLTETLIECGVNVVGRTRFCIHPQDKVKDIARVGGTKDINWDKCRALNPDLVIFDREENPKEMAEQCPYPWLATHITSLDDIADELQKVAVKLASKQLSKLAEQWRDLAQQAALPTVDWASVPGQISALNNTQNTYQQIEYIIWQDPWMAVSQQTFIGSMLQKIGFAGYLPKHAQAYPTLSAGQMAKPNTFYLFSSEPYPFARHRQALIEAGFNGAIVDGEVYSWFGIRSYHALKSLLNKPPKSKPNYVHS